ncbi:dihydrolipoyl dehydrogenase [Pseudaminobacter arsenicus]|uniref:Dihydrolipoyl dehydrogenase n=1 Tax=Borborobacter arsenicus TaxID=1851146 RepID=A0A432V2F3_9HYPH|nr:dihydrolipoyl dehydrogenase [Pseudaminobacter arsenicus]RUM96316.1 dihydrolipoyl dehydrogenase [Pseudaminobacter arsenicus]
MNSIVEIHVPDIGDFADVAVIEIAVKPGDEVNVDQALITLESDKAALDVPSPLAGHILSLTVAIGDRVSKGTLIAMIETSEAVATVQPHAVSTATRSPAISSLKMLAPTAGGYDCDVAVIGGGPGGYSAAFRAADLGMQVVLIERYDALGGVCLNVGCIPSKTLLHVAAIKEEAEQLADHGVSFGAPQIDLDKLRQFKSAVVGRLTDGLKGMARMRKVEVLHGTASFASPHSLTVTQADGGRHKVSFANCIIAAGSSPVALPFLPDSPRIVNSTGALELPFTPARMLIIGGGIIGLEMATVYGALGAKIDIVEMLDGLLPGVDRDAVEIWRKRNAGRFGEVMLGTRVDKAVADADGVTVTTADGVTGERRYDLVLQSAGRRPNGASLGLEAAGLVADARGFIAVDRQMRTALPHILAIGDIVGNPMLAHKAVHEGHVAAEAAAGMKSSMDARIIPSVAYTDPEIAWVGVTEDGAKAEGRAVTVTKFPWAASGRAVANGAGYGVTKLVFDPATRRIIGGAIVGPNAGDMIGEICLAIEMGADAIDIGKTIHPHPTLGETIGMAAELFEGVCTDLPPEQPARPEPR